MSVIDLAASPSDLRTLAEQSNAWPFEQAKAIVARLKKSPKDEVLFETGYGPSGLPHIGTFGEVARTTMVRHAFRVLTEDKIKTRLLAFSDDMDGLRKVPDNVPNKEMLAAASRQAADRRCPIRFGTHPASARTTTRGCAPSSTLRLRLRVRELDRLLHARASSTRRCCACWSGSMKVMAIMLPIIARGARGELFAVPADLSAHRPGAATCRSSRMTPRPARFPTTTPRPGSASPFPSPAAIASCNGSRTGRCAGSRSASTMKWPART